MERERRDQYVLGIMKIHQQIQTLQLCSGAKHQSYSSSGSATFSSP